MSDDIWHYIVPASEPPSNWNTTTFDDSGWLTGKGGIGYGDGDDSTDLISWVNSLYMRITFNVIDPGVISYGVLNVDVDDGFVAYLNGHEIARTNIGTAGVRPAYTDFANICTEPLLPYGGTIPYYLINGDTLAKYLKNGNNVLALQVHNCSKTSSDLSSTTFFSVGISNSDTYYRPVPSWFNVSSTTSSMLPIIAIDTKGQDIPDTPKIMATCKVIDHGPGKTNDLFDSGTDYEGPIGIGLHGQSTQMFPKKTYSIEIRKTETIDSTASLLGMPSSPDWILHAHYTDKSMLRNALTYWLGGRLGSWQPRIRQCVVYLDGQYNGIYLLIERIKRDSARVNISKLAETDNPGDELTGGYILKVDKTWNLTQDEYFTTYPAIVYPNSRSYNFTYVYPKADRITYQQKNYINSFLTNFETILNGNYFDDPVLGFRKFINVGSFVDYQIMEEFINNVDGYRYSTFFYKDKITHGNRLHAGPLWDHDLCFGNEDYYPWCLATSGWLYPHYGPDERYTMHWWYRLMEDPGYVRTFVMRYRELRKGPFSTESIMHFIDSTTTYLGAEVARNYQKWPILGTYVWPNAFIGTTYEQEINYLKGWITDRLTWMDSATEPNSDLYKESFSNDGITLFPVPVKDNLTIVFDLVDLSRMKLELVDLFGKKIYEEYYIPPAQGNQEVIIDMSHFKTGYYILKISQGSRTIGIKKVAKY